MSLTKKFDVLGLGAVAVDDFIFVNHLPPPDGKAQVLRRDRHCGGLTAIALIAAARLEARCAYAGTLGADGLSGFALEKLRREGINVAHVKVDPLAKPISSNIIVDETNKTRTIFFDLQGVVGAAED